MDVSVIIPVKDEADSLESLVDELRVALDGHLLHEASSRWEVIFVDDGSEDASWQVIRQLVAIEPRIRGLRFRRNLGKSAALAAGIEESTGAVIVTMDGDLQDDPAEIPGMLKQLEGAADLVAGHKEDRKDPISKTWPSKLFNFVTSVITGLKLRDHNCGLKVGRREAFENVALYGEMHRFLAAIAHAQGFTVVEQSVNHRPRRHGTSKFGLERYARGALDLLTVVTLTRYSRRPAHLFGGLGILAGLVGGLILMYLTGIWFLTDQGIGNRPLLLLGVLLVVLAVQLVSLGVLAELLVNQQAALENPRRHVIERADAAGRGDEG